MIAVVFRSVCYNSQTLPQRNERILKQFSDVVNEHIENIKIVNVVYTKHDSFSDAFGLV